MQSETWESVINAHLLNIGGYRKTSHARPLCKTGEGVAMFVKEILNVVQLIKVTTTSFESLFIEIVHATSRTKTIFFYLYIYIDRQIQISHLLSMS